MKADKVSVFAVDSYNDQESCLKQELDMVHHGGEARFIFFLFRIENSESNFLLYDCL